MLALVTAAGRGLAREAGLPSDGIREMRDGPPPLVKCAALEPLPAHLRPRVLPRTAPRAGEAAGSVFQYKATVFGGRPAPPARRDDQVRAPVHSHNKGIWSETLGDY